MTRDVCLEASRTDVTAPIVVLTVDEIAGLEFDSVVVFEPTDIMIDGHARLFVAITRAVRRLAVIGSSIPNVLRDEAQRLGTRCTSNIPTGARKPSQRPASSHPKKPPASRAKPKPKRPPVKIDWTKASGSGVLGEDYKGWWTGG